MDFVGLAEKIEYAARQAFTEMYEKYGGEHIYAFALYSDEGAMTVCPSTNTLDFIESKKGEEDFEYYKFEPAEWKYEMQGANKLFNAISKLCYDEVEKIGEDEQVFESFQNQLYTTCIDVLKKLKSENFFKKLTGQDIFLIFSVTEYEFDKSELKDIINTLNDNEYNQEYLEWMKIWDW